MADIIPFRPRKPDNTPGKNSLCRHGHHKWEIDKTRRFDVKEGRLVTLYRCARCGKQRVRAD